MSKFIKTIAVVASLFAAGSAFANDCGHLVFKGVSANHKKEVRVCIYSANHQNYVQYRFGKIGQKPELEFVQPAKMVDWSRYHSYMSEGMDLTINNGAYKYYLGSGVSDDGAEYGHVTVYKGEKELAEIKLDTQTVTTDTSVIVKDEYYTLSDFGLTSRFENDDYRSQTKVLAPALTN